MEKIKVAIQGFEGSYHHIAANNYFDDTQVEIKPCYTFKEIFKSIQHDSRIVGMMAIENTVAGSLLNNYNLLRDSHYKIIGEYKLRIAHDFSVLPGQQMGDIKEVLSHPMALMQCELFLEQYPHVKIIESEDTALAAKEISEQQVKGRAAICSTLATKMYGLNALASSIETNKRNYTRFLVIADTDSPSLVPQIEQPIDKASLVFSLPHSEGSLSKVLTILSFYNINLTKIQSMPVIGYEWEYLFYIDLTFDNYDRYKQSLEAIKPLTAKLKILGEYNIAKQSFDDTSC